VRSEGTRNLLAAATAAGARRFVCQSIAFAYAPGPQPEIKVEDDPLASSAPPPFGEGVRVVDEMEHAVLESDGLEGLVLRYGWFYGPGPYYAADGSMAADVRKRRFPIVGSGAGLFSFVHVDDAAAATAIAVERGAPGAYNVVDDEPAALRDWLPVYAEAMGAPPPRRVPVWLARLIAGKVATIMGVQPGASNAKAKHELGWQPRWSSWRQGFRDAPR
jgi:nucleoside-diphosphate-sugar epimerase